jgi:O-antigen ligase
MNIIISLFLFFRPFIPELILKQTDIFLNIIFVVTVVVYLVVHKRFKQRYYDKFFFLFIVAMLISLCFSTHHLLSAAMLYKYICPILLCYFFALSQEEKKFLPVLIISALCVSLYSLRGYFIISGQALRYLHTMQNISSFSEEFILRKRAFVPFVLPNLLGGYLAMVIPLSVGCIIQRAKNNRKDFVFVAMCVSCLVSCVVLFLTKSIGAFCALLGACCVYFFLGKWKYKKISLLIIVGLLIITAVVVASRFHTGSETTHPSFSLKMRVSYWNEALGIISERPFTGVGLGKFSLYDTRFAHNSYFQVWAEMGIVGLISWLTIIVLFFSEGIEKLKMKGNVVYRGAFIAGVSFIIHNFLDFTFFVPQVSFLWWILLGLMVKEKSAELLSP